MYDTQQWLRCVGSFMFILRRCVEAGNFVFIELLFNLLTDIIMSIVFLVV